MKNITWSRLAVTALLAGSTYYLRVVLNPFGLQVLTYLLWDWFDGGLRDGWR